ncbi:MAG TPA: potassium/proton antiporter [Pseudonocardia sp.]|jgi:cell volume regulation protein A|uniref:potassium/proton antiporter n=1 Tax=Pseudonocardia sp. TaxID=60912 RepID=UPI002B4AEBB2|nr:potassium/proton antiporter [Pseudonocardia sp.]HLU59087.1 potassium/proton antiporter [Pseudonocardia sp.]
MTLSQLYVVLLAGGAVVLASIAAARAAARLGLPSLLLFLALGVAIGEDGLGIEFDDAQLAQNLGAAALAVILVEGGITTRWSDVRSVLAPSGVLATAGVGISVVVTAAGAHLLLGMDWQLALLIGAIVSSTDAAAVFAVLRGIPVSRRMAGLLEAESGFNDAPTVILVTLFATTPLQEAGIGGVTLNLLYQLVVGATVGLGLGRLGVAALRRIALPSSGLYPLATFGIGILAFAAAGAAQASGIIAAYLSGIVLGNAGLPHRMAIKSFAEGLGWLAQIALFVLLGLLITPSELGPNILPALVIGVVLLLVARPVSVVLCLIPFRVPWRQQVFISWAGLRGAVPIVLATFPIVAGVPGSDQILDIVFVGVVVFTLIQGPSLPIVGRALRLIPRHATRELQVEAAPLDQLDAELLTLAIPPGSRLHGVALFELRLPPPTVVSLIIRNGETIVPERDTRLLTGDELLIVTTSRTREPTERRLRAVSRRGRLAHWFGEDGDPDPV